MEIENANTNTHAPYFGFLSPHTPVPPTPPRLAHIRLGPPLPVNSPPQIRFQED